jgi:hypothetical protein
LEKNGFPLVYVSKLFVLIELKSRQQGNSYSLPILIHLTKLIDAIYCLRSIDGGNEQITKLKKELCTLVSNATKGSMQERKIANTQITNMILSYGNEFQIGCMLYHLYPSLKINKGKGPDFKIHEFSIKVEAKSKLNRSYLGTISDPTIQLDKSICLKLVSKDVFESGRLEEAFECQETDIAIMNASHSQFGDIFASYAYGLDNLNFGLFEAFEQAIEMQDRKRKQS